MRISLYGHSLLFCLVLTVCLFFIAAFNLFATSGSTSPSRGRFSLQKSSKNAFVVFLAPNKSSKVKRATDFPDEDHYFTGTRMLIYQLLHDPESRTNTSIPVVVLVTKGVSQANRDQLTKDGATVKEVNEINFDWIKPDRNRWAHVMNKLHVFELVEYDKVLLLDTDIVVTQRIDGVFDDLAAQLAENKRDPDKVHADEYPQPSTYIMAGNGGPTELDHPYPAPRNSRLNAGFVVLKPSIEMYKHYLSVASIQGRFRGTSPEQDLWNYVHDRHGNMPWTQLNTDWTINTPVFNDYEKGVKTFHEKYWAIDRDARLRDLLLKSKWKMEGFFDAYHRK